jgi:acetoin utilization deacetylase AcuC-like enzyme
MAVALYTHPDMFDHRPGPRHPERPERLRAVIDALDDAGDLDLAAIEAPLAEERDLALVHPKAFIDAMMALHPGEGVLQLDPDTYVSAGSLAAET